ncbi:MAG TPA: DUF2303 family protein [Phycisphaerae bacterium]|nr:DUF2303 family protein [Phycisphaerae bacterium]
MDASNKDAIQDFIRSVQKGQENALEIVREALPDGEGERTVVALQNRQLQPEPPQAPERAESPRRAHVFNEVDGFIRYLQTYGTERTMVLADVQANQISAIIDETADKGFEVVRLKPTLHPELTPWLAILDEEMPVLAFAQHVMKNRRTVAEPDGRDLALLLSQMRCATTVQLKVGRGAKAVNGLMVTTEISGERKTEPVDLPDFIRVEAPLYVGEEPVTFDIDLLVSSADHGTEIVVAASCPDLRRRMTEAFLTWVARLEDIEGITAALGKPQHENWDYLTHQE